MTGLYPPFSPDGHTFRWERLDGLGSEETTLRWENEGWTITGAVSRERVQYVIRTSSAWKVRQFMLFRDLEDPDLWLATDGRARWGEMNGAHRTELDGCYDIALSCTPFTSLLPIRRLQLLEGDAAEFPVVVVDPDTLGVHAETHRYTRVASHHWRIAQGHPDNVVEFDVDQHGLALDHPGTFRRLD
ncbi:MAG: putative glycolipid-binding domain-containing protein [Ilumatobacteraceae bacterium]